MKTNSFCTLLFLFLSTTVFAQHKHKKEIWIDRFDFEIVNFETKQINTKTPRGEVWVAFNDITSNGESVIKRSFDMYDKSHGGVLNLSYTLKQGASKDDPYVGIFCSIEKGTYPDSIMYVAYDYKGSGHSFMFRTSDIKDFCYYKKDLPASTEWQSVLIPLTDLTQPSWGKKANFTPTELNGLQWFVQGKNNETGNLRIDNIRLVYSPTEISSLSK